jgi:hypothetical protein
MVTCLAQSEKTGPLRTRSKYLSYDDGAATYIFDVAGTTAGAYPVVSDGHGGTLIDPTPAAPKALDPRVLAFAHAAAAFSRRTRRLRRSSQARRPAARSCTPLPRLGRGISDPRLVQPSHKRTFRRSQKGGERSLGSRPNLVLRWTSRTFKVASPWTQDRSLNSSDRRSRHSRSPNRAIANLTRTRGIE